ncbi:hypothetical protein DRN46_05335 [Thermococci archaeon]|nr:MAG: hypothetical protein DRN46_05335 [Thermococci archaeon]RLF95501.1 MAG: hypothetical protein DRN52_03830 [Thermococci archaeon]
MEMDMEGTILEVFRKDLTKIGLNVDTIRRTEIFDEEEQVFPREIPIEVTIGEGRSGEKYILGISLIANEEEVRNFSTLSSLLERMGMKGNRIFLAVHMTKEALKFCEKEGIPAFFGKLVEKEEEGDVLETITHMMLRRG